MKAPKAELSRATITRILMWSDFIRAMEDRHWRKTDQKIVDALVLEKKLITNKIYKKRKK